MGTRTYNSSVREQQVAATRQRILAGLASLLERENPALVSVPAVANEAGVSTPTVYRYFPTKEALFEALADSWHHTTFDGEPPRTIDEAVTRMPGMYRYVDKHEGMIRATWAAGAAQDVRRKLRRRRRASADQLFGAVASKLPDDEGRLFKAFGAAIGSPMVYLHMKEYFAVTPDEAADIVGWAMTVLAREVEQKGTIRHGSTDG